MLAGLVSLGGCATAIPPVSQPAIPSVPVVTAPIIDNARLAGISPGPSILTLGVKPGDAASALIAFRRSCPKLLVRSDATGLLAPSDWETACAAATGWREDRAHFFFDSHLETARVGDGTAFVTGYFEPEIAGSRVPLPGYDTPVYGMPDDLVRAWPDDMAETEREGRPPLGRYDADGTFVTYYTRAEIEQGALAGRGLEIGWAKDPVELFFLQIQGSGRLISPTGEVTRIGYAGQNGRAYTGIGSVMRERGLLGDGPGQYAGSMQGLMAYIRENPEAGAELMRLNESWIFFRELTGEGPIGAMGVAVSAEDSVAVDPRFVPLGAPVWLDLDRAEADGMWVAQDTGGAIKGANRFDTFWGAGARARDVAGGMSGRGSALVFLPKGTLARFAAE